VNPIPYTVERRPDTGMNNVKLGVWLFLASEVMLFGGLFSAYFMLRAGMAAWTPLESHRTIAMINTAFLVASGLAFSVATDAARAADVRRFRVWSVLCLAMAFEFIAFKSLEYTLAMHDGLYPRTSTEGALYYLLTGVHAAHVFGGMLVTLWLAMTRTRTWQDHAPVVINRLEATALYWYFVDVVWLIIFVLLYVA